VSVTDNISEILVEELSCKTVFEIPIFGGIAIRESVVVTWIIMLAIVIISKLLVRKLSVEKPSRKQLALETVIGGIYKIIHNLIGDHGKKYIPYLMTVMIYLGFANLIGLLGFKPPTKDINVTASLAIMSIILIEYAGISHKGVKGWVKGFAEPSPLIAPLNVLELFIKPLSLCMRLFGNILGGFVVMEIIKIMVPYVMPVPFSFYFDIFDGLIQAYIFVFLTSLYINEAIE